MKYAEDFFPKGTFPDQQTDGAYIDETLAHNLDIYAKNINNDMHFLLLITGNDSVGNGKSTLATQIGTYLTWKINQLHGLNNKFDHKNIFFNSMHLMKNSMNNPKCSVQLLDEGDDLTTQHMKELAVRLKRYFRKCRQLNQIVILILPSFFELPKFYALARSHCLINVKFGGEFERGYFDFYGPTNKKLLYLKGKKEWNYDAQKKDFHGVFSQSYTFLTDNLQQEVAIYKKKKYVDLEEDNQDTIDSEKSPEQIRHEVLCEVCYNINKQKKLSQVELSELFSVSDRTIWSWIKEYKALLQQDIDFRSRNPTSYTNILVKDKEENDEEGGTEDGIE